MKKKLFSFMLINLGILSMAQVGIGTENPNPDSDLTLASPDKGLLLNKVALSGTTSASPLSAHVEGMTVYNTANSGDVTPGTYYNDGTKWVRQGAGSVAADTSDWKIVGNSDANITASTDALGAPYTAGNVLGTQGPTDNLVAVSGGKVHSILSTDGTLNGGGEATSSFSWGMTNTVGTKNNIAVGNNNTANGQSTIALGDNSLATGDYSAAIGRGNDNSAANSMVLGLTNTVSGNKNYVLGYNNQVTSPNSTVGTIGHTFVAGSNNTVSALNSVVLGHSNNLTSAGHVLGTSNTGRGTMIGFNNTNDGTAFLIGGQNTSTAAALRSIVIGFTGHVTATNTTLMSNGYHFFNHNTTGNITEVGINITSADIVENIDLTVDRAIRIKPQTPVASDPNQVNCTTTNEGTIRYNQGNRKHQGCGTDGSGNLAWRDLY